MIADERGGGDDAEIAYLNEQLTRVEAEMAGAVAEYNRLQAEFDAFLADHGHDGCAVSLMQMQTRAEQAEVERDRLMAALALDTPWPVTDVLDRLAAAADHLLSEHNCDAHGWEGVAVARDKARELAAALRRTPE